LNVSNLERSVAFYRILFGKEPAKQRPDYAKFELDDPPLVLSLEPIPCAGPGALNHAGFRMPDATALIAMQQRLELAGIRSQREEGVECCYARQTKFWVTDPDHTLWEIYTLEEDLDHRGAGQSREQMLPQEHHSARSETTPAESATSVVWQHVLIQPVPKSIPLADASADEVHLLGTFNLPLQAEVKRRLLEEAARVLRPGGRLFAHVLVADRPLPSAPHLPGPAALVQHVPVSMNPRACWKRGALKACIWPSSVRNPASSRTAFPCARCS
jgi:catechol 2,3-dioxygenase-like lactoylglutathione lyase family enzyme